MELLQLKYFCDAAKTENFSKTARKFLVPASNISQSVKRLEHELGVELFEHHSNKVTLSEIGMRFYIKACEALLLLEEAKNDVQSTEEISGDIKLLIFCNRRMVTEAIERFKADHPHVNFILRHEIEAELDCDIMIADECPVGYIEERILADEQILLALNREHKMAGSERIAISALSGERFISMPKGRSLCMITEEVCRESGFEPNISIQTDDPYYVRKYVELGLGIAFVPSCSWEGLFSENVVLKNVGNIRRRTYVCCPQKKVKRAAVSTFLDYLP